MRAYLFWKYLPVLLLLTAWSLPVLGRPYVSYTGDLQPAFGQIFHLRFQEATLSLKHASERWPGNLAVDHLENYADCLSLFVSEDKTRYKKLLPARDRRLRKVQALPDNDPARKYLRADILLQWAAVKLKFGDQFSAMLDVRRAYKALEENLSEFPDHVLSRKDMAVLQALIGTVPDQYRWGVQLLGLSGDIGRSVRELQALAVHRDGDAVFFRDEIIAAGVLIEYYLNNRPGQAIARMERFPPATQKSPLYIFMAANIYRRQGLNEQALALLDTYKPYPGATPFTYLDFLKGDCLLRRIDRDAARHLQYFIDHHKGQNYLKEAYQKLAWHALVQGDTIRYRQMMRQVLDKGQSLLDEDRSALSEARTGMIPHVGLLKARLYYDGGYYRESERILEYLRPDDLEGTWRLEWLYRRARVQEKMNRPETARRLYREVIAQGSEDTGYFACNAALQLGLLAEEAGQPARARAYYEQCLSMEPDQYRNSLHQKARAGLQRLR